MYIDNKYNLVLPKTIDLPKEVYLTFVDNNTLIICSKINELSFSKDKDIRNTIRIILSNTFKVINNNFRHFKHYFFHYFTFVVALISTSTTCSIVIHN